MEAFGRLAAETRAMEALGPPLAESNPRLRVPPEALSTSARVTRQASR